MIIEGLVLETLTLIALSALLLANIRSISIENLPLLMERIHVVYNDKVMYLDEVLLHNISKKLLTLNRFKQIKLAITLAKLKKAVETRRDYVILGRMYEKINSKLGEKR